LASVRSSVLGHSRLPQSLRGALSEEGLALLEEDLRGSITYRDYRVRGEKGRLPIAVPVAG
jgi:hypothetical protein